MFCFSVEHAPLAHFYLPPVFCKVKPRGSRVCCLVRSDVPAGHSSSFHWSFLLFTTVVLNRHTRDYLSEINQHELHRFSNLHHTRHQLHIDTQLEKWHKWFRVTSAPVVECNYVHSASFSVWNPNISGDIIVSGLLEMKVVLHKLYLHVGFLFIWTVYNQKTCF